MTPVEKFLTDIVLRSLLVFLVVGCAAALIIGLWMLFRPDALARLNARMAGWISTRRALKPLMVPHKSEPLVYRHHRVSGALVLAGAGYTLYSILYRFNMKATVALFVPPHNRFFVEWLVESAVAVLAAGSILAIAIGTILAVRPSLLKGFEAWANRRFSPRAGLRFLEIMHYQPDKVVTRHPRYVAVLIILGSLYAIATLGYFLL